MTIECITPCFTIGVDDLTDGNVNGSGVFDVMMRSVREHLKREHDAGRITGNDFTNAYVAGMQAVLANATQFTLQKDAIGYQVALLSRQVELTEEQLNQIKAQTALTEAQTIKLQGPETDLTEEQVKTQEQQTLLVTSQISKLDGVDTDLVLEQGNKVIKEQELIEQRTQTELAQVKDVFDDGSEIKGIMGQQRSLYANQSQGYIRDAEQKAAKIMTESYITRVSTETGNPDSTVAAVGDLDCRDVITALKEGIGVPGPAVELPDPDGGNGGGGDGGGTDPGGGGDGDGDGNLEP